MFAISDWLILHDLQASVLRDAVTAYYIGELPDSLSEVEEQPASKKVALCLGSQEQCLKTYVIPSLAEGFPDNEDVGKILQSSAFKSLTTGQVGRPRKVDRGAGQSPFIKMNWRARPENLMCLAHDAAHALQTNLSGQDAMPPIARETCAFIGELLLLRFVKKKDPDLYLELERVWAEENAVYLFDNLDSLAEGLLNEDVPYHYCMNYPLARLAAVQFFTGNSISLTDLFSSGASAMRHLPIEEMAARTAALTKYLPRPHEPDTNASNLESCRDREAFTVLDLGVKSQAKSKLQGYYSTLQAHLFEDTVLVWQSADRRPMGCAACAGRSNDNTSEVARRTTPFGGHVRLQQLLDLKRKPANVNVFHKRGEPV